MNNRLFSINKLISTKNTLIKTQRKNFSMFNNKATTTSRTLGYGLLGIGVSGLGYIMYNNMKNNAHYTKSLISSSVSLKSEIVNQRTRDTMTYFCSGLGLTAATAFFLSKSPVVMKFAMSRYSMLLSLPATLFFIFKMSSTPIDNSMKPAFFVGFNAMMAFSLCPLIASMPIAVLRDAALLTGGTFGGLGAVAVTSKDNAFIGWSGVLGAGLGGLCAVSIANIFMQSTMIHNIWLYGGLGLFLAFTMYDIKEVQIRAKKEAHFDPMWNSVSIYLDFINIFIRLALILNNRK
jgi:FtsH-binding integral membrane protein